MEKRKTKKWLSSVVVAVLLIHIIFGEVDGGAVWAEGEKGIGTLSVGSGNAEESSGDAEESSGDAEESSGDAEESSGDAVDMVAPILEIQGMSSGYMSEDDVEICLTVKEDNHNSPAYELIVVRSDLDGELERFLIQGEEKTAYDVEEGWKLQEENEVSWMERKLRFQEEGIYQLTFRGTDQAGNEGVAQYVSFYIDKTAPIISNITYSDANGSVVEQYNQVISNQSVRIEFQVWDQVTGVKDEEVYIQLQGNATAEGAVFAAHKGVDNMYYVQVPEDLGSAAIKDTLTIYASDCVGNQNKQETKKIVINADKPEIFIESAQDYTKWTNQNVTFQTTIADENIGLKEVVYKVAGKIVHKKTFDEITHTYSYDVVVSKEAEKITGCTVTVEAVNNAGTKNSVKRHVYIDKTAPEVSLSGVSNGTHYNQSQRIVTQVQDVSYKGTDTEYFITCKLDEETEIISVDAFSASGYEDEHTFDVSKEGLYEIYAVTTDAAGNQKKSNTLSFVIDKTAPKVCLDGISEGKVLNSKAVLNVTCEESFYQTCTVEVDVERTLDGITRKESMDEFSMNKKRVTESRVFEKDGSYTVRVMARDKAGNIAQEKIVTFIVDCTAPEIRIIGTKNYQMWSQEVALQLVVEESYYKDNTVIIKGNRRDIDGKAEAIVTPFWRNTGKISEIQKTFEEDGIYELQIIAEDGAGNRQTKSVHFTIDQEKPEIYGISQYDGEYYQYFQMTDSSTDIFRDLTVLSYHIFLNGVEYNGTDRIETEGKYNLYVEAEDELGHKNYQSVEFVIDQTPPRVIFQGIGTSKVVTERGEVTWKLENVEDRITGVRVNDREYDVQTMSFPFKEYGAYKIEVDCEDRAGNTATRELRFVYADAPTSMSRVIGVIGLIALVGICVGICRRRKEWQKR